MRGSLLPCCETSRVLLFPRYGQNKWGVHLSPRSSVRGDTAVGDDVILANVLKKYVESFYRKRQRRWESERMEYAPITKDDENFQDYIVRVPRSDRSLLNMVHEAIEDWKKVQKRLSQDLPNIHFDRHLYQPLLIQKGDKIHSVPPSLIASEQRFVDDLIEFCKSKPEALKHKELFLLRNLSRGKGIGFFEDTGFYPDFILWVTEGDKQRLVFIEPHGMRLESHPDTNPKVNLHLKLKVQEAEARKKSKLPTLSLDAFIISATPFDDLHRQHGIMWNRLKYAESHIFFGDEEDKGHIRGIIIG